MSTGALGMLETYGLISAIEGLDAAVKAANVSVCGFKYVQGGLVCFFVTGDVGATKAAIAAGEIAADKVGKVISSHVIPRPADSTSIIAAYKEKPAGRRRGTGIHKREFPSSAPVKSEEAVKAEEPKSVPGTVSEAVGYTEEVLREMKTTDLRRLAREIPEIGLSKIEIRDAKKDPLVEAILKAQKK